MSIEEKTKKVLYNINTMIMSGINNMKNFHNKVINVKGGFFYETTDKSDIQYDNDIKHEYARNLHTCTS